MAMLAATTRGSHTVREAILKHLIACGAALEFQDRDGCTALHSASINKQTDWAFPCINGLLEAGADLQARDKEGRTPLRKAHEARCTANVELLLLLGADPDTQDLEKA